MKKIPTLFILLLVGAAIVGIFFSRQFLGTGQPEAIAALRISSFPQTDVYLGGQKVGTTPYFKEKIKPGEYVVKLIAQKAPGTFLPWEGKVGLYAGSETYVNENLSVDKEKSSGQILWLEPIARADIAQLTIVSDPDGAGVFIDGLQSGSTPLSLNDVNWGDHDISVSKTGYGDEDVKANFVKGYRLNISIKLGRLSLSETTATASASPRPTSEIISSGSADLTKPYVIIRANELGYLRVRTDPSPSATESGQVKPGEKYPLVSQSSDWVQIKWGADLKSMGWVNSQYVVIYK